MNAKPHVKSALNVIPEMTNKLGKYWEQPERKNIFIDQDFAYMDKSTFNKLKQYDLSCPSGTYIGKMWKSMITDDTDWRLRWYHKNILEDNQAFTLIYNRFIKII